MNQEEMLGLLRNAHNASQNAATPEEAAFHRRNAQTIAKRISAASEKPEPEPFASWMSPVMQGLTGYWADELGQLGAYAGARAAGRTPKEASRAGRRELQRQRKEYQTYRRQKPFISPVTEMAAAIAAGGPLVRLGGTVPRMIGVAGAEGALMGAGAAEEGSRLPGFLWGSGLGMTAAGILPGALVLLQSGSSAARSRIIDPIVQRFRDTPQTAAGRILQDSFQRQTPDQLRQAQQRLGPMATPADIGGPDVMGLTQGVIGLSDQATRRARRLAEQRRAAQPQELRRDIGAATGNRQRMLQSLDEISERQRIQSSQAYQASNMVDITPDDELINIMNRPSVKRALPVALREAADAGRPLPQLERIVMSGDDFAISRENFPDMQALDTVKKAMDRMVNSAYRTGDPTAYSIRTARDALKDKLDDVNPIYRDARNIWAGDQALTDAMEAGEMFLTQKTRQVQEATRNLTDSEREAYLTGAVEAIRERMGRARGGQISEFNFLETENAREKLRMILPEGQQGDEALETIMNTLNRARTFAQNETEWVRGSQTQMRAAAQDRLGADVMLPGTIDAMRSPVQGAIGALYEAGRKLLKGQSQETLDELGRILLTPNNLDELSSFLNNQQVPPAQIRQLLDRYVRTFATAAPGITAGTISEVSQ